MIEAKQALTGTLNNAVEYIQPATQEKEVTPSLEVQEVTPDKDYTGLSRVTIGAVTNEIDINIQPNNIKLGINILGVEGNIEPDKPDQTKEVTPTQEIQTIIPDTGYELASVKVNAIPSNYIEVNGTLDISVNGEYDVKNYEKANVNIELPTEFPKITNAGYLFDNNARVDYINEFISMISPECTNFLRAFNNIKMMPPYFDTSNGQDFSSCFSNNSYLNTLPAYDFSNAINCNSMFNTCMQLKVVPLLNLGKCTNASNMFSRCQRLQTLGGFKDLGKAYLTTNSANYGDYKLDLSASSSITYESLMNVINNLYDIASAGVQPQQLVIGSTNLAKLTEEEIAIAQTKGWTVL